jgi:Beta-propeller repeat
MALAAGLAGGAAGCGDNLLPESDEPTHGVIRHFNMTSDWSLRGDLFGDAGEDEATDVLVGPNGKVYVSGFRNGQFGQSAVEPSGNAYGVVSKYSSWSSAFIREHTWEFGKSNTSAEVIEALAVAPNAQSNAFDLYFTGRSNGAYAGAHGGQFDTIVGWIHNWGVEKFQYGNVKPQHPKRLFVNSASEVIVTGYDDLYIPTNYVDSWEDPYVLKVRRTGNVLGAPPMGWPYQPQSTNSDVLLGMTTTAAVDAPVYVAGTTITGAGRGMFMRKLLTDGTVEWNLPISGVGLDSAAALHTMPNGDLLFVGASFQQFGENSYGEQDIVVRLIDPVTKTAIWTQQHGTEFSELATDMTVDRDGNIYIVGETLGSFDPDVAPQGEIDIFLLKLWPDGTLADAFHIGTPGDERPTSVAVDLDGRVYVAGYTTGNIFGGDDYEGGRDGFVFRVTPPSFGTFER